MGGLIIAELMSLLNAYVPESFEKLDKNESNR